MSWAAEGSGHMKAEEGPAKAGPVTWRGQEPGGRGSWQNGRRTDISTERGAGQSLEGQEMAVLTVGIDPHVRICWRSDRTTGGLEGDPRRLEPRLAARLVTGGWHLVSGRCWSGGRPGGGICGRSLWVASAEKEARSAAPREGGEEVLGEEGGVKSAREGTEQGCSRHPRSVRRTSRNAATWFPGLCKSTER